MLSGNGKGKSTAAFGLAARALGHEMRIAVIQFIQGYADTGEARFFRGQPGVDWYVMGEETTAEIRSPHENMACARSAWERARRFLSDETIGLVILDELNAVLNHGDLDADTVLRDIAARPSLQHVIVTGRSALPVVIDAADTVTHMRLTKHAFDAGIRAMPGMEF